jgi:bidirectional [NiFe] hydrogenase diaphorase subunit
MPSLAPPTDDKRWRVVQTTMRRHGNDPSALIETLHSVQESFGYLDDASLKFVAASLRLPTSKVYGVATFYNYFSLKPQGEHTCVVCLGTACYIKGGRDILNALQQATTLKPGQTSPDKAVSLLTARCLGTCGLAPVAVYDDEVVGKVSPTDVVCKVKEWMAHER